MRACLIARFHVHDAMGFKVRSDYIAYAVMTRTCRRTVSCCYPLDPFINRPQSPLAIGHTIRASTLLDGRGHLADSGSKHIGWKHSSWALRIWTTDVGRGHVTDVVVRRDGDAAVVPTDREAVARRRPTGMARDEATRDMFMWARQGEGVIRAASGSPEAYIELAPLDVERSGSGPGGLGRVLRRTFTDCSTSI